MPASTGVNMEELERKFPYRKGNFQIFSHPDCLLHDVGEYHPERSERLVSVLRGCAGLPSNLPVSFRVPEPAEMTELELVHGHEYLQGLENACQRLDSIFMSPDNHISQSTFSAVRAAAGCALALAETLASGGAGFALVRPPGHHAGVEIAEGFCFVNHIALAIESIRKKEPDADFLVVDFDVHHGNGIDSLYYDDPKVYYFSLHGIPEHIYPHTGHAHETGRGAGIGCSRNISLPLNSSGDDWLACFETGIHDFKENVAPDYLLVGAGFDAHREDPFGVMNVEDRHFLKAVDCLRTIADERCSGKLGLFLEGGYSGAVLERVTSKIIALLAANHPQ